jgi:dihydroorotate dehydrogenase (NAD+) catalytic subunit
MKAKRRGVAANSKRTPTVRRIKPAIAPVPKPRAPMPTAPRQGAAPETRRGDAAAIEPLAAARPPALDALGGRPVELGVDLGRGLAMANPIMVAAGPFGYGVEVADVVDLPRLGALVTRSTSPKPRAGHPGPRMAEVPAGLLLGMGVQNPGLDTVLDRYPQVWARWPVPVILSLCADSAGELGEAVRRLEDVPGIDGVEVNLSCGGGRGAVPGIEAAAAASYVGAARRGTDLPVIAKLTAAAADMRAIARAVEQAGADAIAAINTLPGFLPAPDRRSPALGSTYGGLCGPALRPIALRVVWEVAQTVDVPVIGIGGVATVDDVLDFLAVGASAVGVGVAALADPMLPVRLADDLADACRERGIERVSQLVGTALPRRPAPPSTRGAEYAR